MNKTSLPIVCVFLCTSGALLASCGSGDSGPGTRAPDQGNPTVPLTETRVGTQFHNVQIPILDQSDMVQQNL